MTKIRGKIGEPKFLSIELETHIIIWDSHIMCTKLDVQHIKYMLSD